MNCPLRGLGQLFRLTQVPRTGGSCGPPGRVGRGGHRPQPRGARGPTDQPRACSAPPPRLPQPSLRSHFLGLAFLTSKKRLNQLVPEGTMGRGVPLNVKQQEPGFSALPHLPPPLLPGLDPQSRGWVRAFSVQMAVSSLQRPPGTLPEPQSSRPCLLRLSRQHPGDPQPPGPQVAGQCPGEGMDR